MGFLSRTPVRTFVVYPVMTIGWEFTARGGTLVFNSWFLPLMMWGYLQYRLCGLYRIKHGGGGPGLERPPERLVATGPYVPRPCHFSSRPNSDVQILARRAHYPRRCRVVSQSGARR